jgi:all-trans-retinol 13,14-reductase
MDYVIAGSGLAGLAFGALMARAGRRVLVVEAHDKPGGYAHTFALGEHRFNAQLHYVWNCGPGETVDRFLHQLGVADRVPFERLDPDGYDRMRAPGYALDLPQDQDELKRRLCVLFPSHQRELHSFIDDIWATEAALAHWPPTLQGLRELPRLARHRTHTLQQVFDAHRLPLAAQTLLALQWPDFLLPPAQLSWFAWVKLFTGYARGAWYPTHHFEQVVDTLVELIVGAGGQLLLNHKVVAFLERDGAMRGVRCERLDDRGAGTGEQVEHWAQGVVCNMDPRTAAEIIGLPRFSRRLREQLSYSYSPSNLVAYLAVKDIDLRDHGFGRSNLFHTEELDLNAAFAAMYERGDYSRPSFAISVPSLLTLDRSDTPPGTQLMELTTVAEYERFHDLKIADARAYRQAKTGVLDALLDVIEAHYVPGLRDHLVLKVAGTPTTSQRYCRAPRGNSYGSDMTPANIGPGRLSYDSSIAGLYFCNASSGYAGFAGTIYTGSRLYEHLSGDRFLGG